MNAMEMKNTARAMTLTAIMDALNANDAVQFGDASFAILQNVDGQEIWTEVTVKAKAYKPTKVADAFDPFVAAEDWKLEKEAKAQAKAERDAEKARKVAKAKAKEVQTSDEE